MNADCIWSAAHLINPLHYRCFLVLRWIEIILHCELIAVSADECCLDVHQFVLTVAVVEELRQLVNYYKFDWVLFVDDTLCIVYAVGSSEIYCGSVFLVRDFHR